MRSRPAIAAVLVAALSATAAAAAPEAAVLSEINRARADPRGFAATLRDFRRAVSPNGVYRGSEEPGFALIEGIGAIDEAIAVLMVLPPRPPMIADARLGGVARDQTAAQGPTGGTGHDGPAGGYATRMAAHGVGGAGAGGEAISYGHAVPTAVVIQLIVDDGVASRGHRAILLNPDYRRAGVACGPHARYGTMCTIDVTTGE